MLNRALVVGIAEAHADQAHVEAGAFGDFGGGFGCGHGANDTRIAQDTGSFRRNILIAMRVAGGDQI